MYASHPILAGVLAAFWLSSWGHAAEPQPYKAMGAPANPKVIARWNRYHDHGEATSLLKQLAHAHADLARLKSLGKSYGGRDMWLMTITNFDQGREEQKAGFWIGAAPLLTFGGIPLAPLWLRLLKKNM